MNAILRGALFFIAAAFIGCGSIQVAGDTKIIELPGQGKAQIYQKAMQWITYKFVSGRSVIDYKDPAAGRIIAKGTLTMNEPMGGRVETFMVATIDCVAGKTKIQVEPADCAVYAPNGSRWPCSSAYMTGRAARDIKLKPSQFVEEYRAYMAGGRAPAWDGR